MGTKKTANADAAETVITIKAPNIQCGDLWIKGTAPLVINKFSNKMKDALTVVKAPGVKNAKDTRTPEQRANDARHISFEGWDGIPACAFRAACIDACRLVGYKMTMAKMSIFIVEDGYDRDEGTALVKIIGGEPRVNQSVVRVGPQKVAAVTYRPQWLQWGARLRFRYDADQFTANDIVNLIARAGIQNGVCEGRPNSSNSAGMGWGTFEISTKEEVMKLTKKGGK